MKIDVYLRSLVSPLNSKNSIYPVFSTVTKVTIFSTSEKVVKRTKEYIKNPIKNLNIDSKYLENFLYKQKKN